MADKLSVSAAQIRAEEMVQVHHQSPTPKRKHWPHVGSYDDALLIRPHREDCLSVYFVPRCPQCHRTKHPQVTRSGRCSALGERHCNHCRIRWTHQGPHQFCSYHGDPDAVLEMLFYGHHGLLNALTPTTHTTTS